MRWIGIALIGAAACGRIGFQRSGSADGDVYLDTPVDVTPFTSRHWTLRSNAAQPGPLFAPRLAFDGTRHEMLLYGGNGTQTGSAMWRLTSTGWSNVCDPCAPGARLNMAFAYDAGLGRVVLFGGRDNSATIHNDTWEWNGSTWSQISAASPPSPRQLVAGVAAFGRVLMVGGTVGTTPSSEVFVYDGGTYAPLALGAGLDHAAGYGAAATFDSHANRVIVLGDDGDPLGIAIRDDLWSFDMTSWTRICQTCTALPRNSASILYDPDLDVTWLFGGFNSSELAGSYQLQGNAFVMTDAALPPARDSVGVAYDPDRHVIVMYGGDGNSCTGNCAETWELVPN